MFNQHLRRKAHIPKLPPLPSSSDPSMPAIGFHHLSNQRRSLSSKICITAAFIRSDQGGSALPIMSRLSHMETAAGNQAG